MKVSMLSLGCLKNQADAERLLARLAGAGISYSPDPTAANAIIVNTCGFIEDAKRESIDAILALASTRRRGQKLIVMGCLSKRYKDELAAEMPEVDAFFGVGEDDKIAAYLVSALRKKEQAGIPVKPALRLARHSAPLKIAEGCSRGCTFCAIPAIRGPYKSRPADEIISEARSCLSMGARELLVVAQDITRFGNKAGGGLATLLEKLANIPDLPESQEEYWVRPLYLYPTEVDERLVETIVRNPRICRYFDIPFQHSEAGILKRMGRKGSGKEFLRLVERIRSTVPDAALRTSLIVGFPGESDKDFEGLLEFVDEARFDHMGAFVYSEEEGTAAAAYERKVPEALARERHAELMELQQGISRSINESLVGSTARCLVEEHGPEGSEGPEGQIGQIVQIAQIGRLARQAPDVDGLVMLSASDAAPGVFIDVRITGAHDYDLEGVIA
jgi:ribosomal protein S12 methylthiotransferase